MKYATNKNRCKKKDRSYRNNYKMISTVDHTGRWLKNIVSSRSATTARPGEYPLRNGAASARSDQSRLWFLVHRLQELGRERKVPLHICFINLSKAFDSVDRELL